MSDLPITISRIAKLAGVGVETIRYYQRIGLLDEPPKPLSGYRYYPIETVSRLKFIQRAKQLGFTLSEIEELLQLDQAECAQAQQAAQRKVEQIRNKIAGLELMAEALNALIQSCRTDRAHRGCPISRLWRQMKRTRIDTAYRPLWPGLNLAGRMYCPARLVAKSLDSVPWYGAYLSP